MADTKKAFHEQVAEKLIEQLKQGTAPWQRPWEPGEPSSNIPINPTTGKRYRGINAIQLMAQDRTDQRWMTYKQAAAIGAQVRKGEKGTPIQYWKFSEEQTKIDENGKPVLDAEGKPVKEEVRLERPRVFFATVFNAEQIDGLPPRQRKEQAWNAIERAEQILQASGAVIRHGGPSAFYRPSTDSIHLPDQGQFPTADNYYATALHELGHWTGHPSRLDRDLAHPFGSEGYAKEELRAEIASMILGDELGIGHDPSQHTAYVGSWIKVLQDDPLEVFRAAADAERIQDYVLSLEQVQEQVVQQSQVQDDAEVVDSNAVLKNPEADMQPIQLNQSASQDEAEISSVSEMNAFEQAAKLARIEEERVRNDPNSTNEDISAAREARKSADLAAVLNDTDMQRRIAENESMLQQAAENLSESNLAVEKTWLAVPYEQHKTVKQIAGRLPDGGKAIDWDKAAKCWYANPGADLDKLKPWLAERHSTRQQPSMTPKEEFAEALRSIGCQIKGDHPIMDGNKHRIGVEGDKKSEQSGFYVGHLDGHPAGYMANNRTGVNIRWKSKGYSLNQTEKNRLHAEATGHLQEREAALQAKRQAVATDIAALLAVSAMAPSDHPYLKAKQVRPGDLRIVPPDGHGLPEGSNIMIGKDWKESKTLRESNPDKWVFTTGDLLVPAYDVNGKVWSVQTIQAGGQKNFAKDSVKQENFHVIGAKGNGLNALAAAPTLVIGEGYATADSVSQTLGFPVVSAFDSGNLLHVAKALHAKFPDKPVIIVGDDDKRLESTQGINPGRSKANEAAQAIGGKVLLPIFAPGEQIEKGLTDFNDLATKSVLGKEGIKRQLCSFVDEVIKRHQAQSIGVDNLQQEHVEKLEQKQRHRRMKN